MGLKSKLTGARISTKLLAINALICIVFFLIVLMVFMSFHYIQGLLRSVIVDDMNEVTTNALIERELSSILTETNLLLSTFFENEEYLNTEGNRLLRLTLVLIGRTKGGDLEQPLQVFEQRLGFLLEQCKAVNTALRRRRTVDHNIMAGINRLEEIISKKLIDLTLKGEDTSILEQLSILVIGYRQSLLEIGKLHAETWPEKYYTPINAEKDSLIAAVDELMLRFRTLMASDPEIAELSKRLINNLQEYREIFLYLNTVMVELKARMDAVNNAKGQMAAVMQKLNRDAAQTTRAANTKITKSFRVTQIALLFISVSLVVVLILLTAGFFKRIIKRPMDDIRDGIEAVRSGNLEARINLNRRDEWHLIENALNSMAAELSDSYTALKRAHGELEVKVMERTSELSEAKVKALEAQQAAESANQAKSEFLARMSHEIRTPLNAVIGLTNVVLKSELTAEQRDYLSKVQIASNNLLEIINDILDFSKVEAGRLELAKGPFDLDQVLERLADIFSHRIAQKDLELIVAIAPGMPRQLAGDAGRLTQVLTNLVENAVKFTDRGEIVVRVELDEGKTVIGDQVIKFSVSDTGIGIAAVVLPTLFEPFIQAEGYLTRSQEGTGLGLAICRRLVELMGGRIWVESTLGKGSTFSFTVMLEALKEEKPRFSVPSDLSGLKTLVVDDSATARQVLGDLLESFTFNVAAVDSSEKAMEELHRAAADEPYQLVLMDWKMPVMDGIGTATAIRNDPNLHRPPIIILVTAYKRELLQARIDTAAVDTFLLKPVKASELFNTIMELFAREEAMVLRRVPELAELPTRLTGQRVLVVEDSALNRDVAVAMLAEAGVEVEIAENGQIAVDKVTESPEGHYDAVLMDIQMPVMDGYQATKKIREWEEGRFPSPSGQNLRQVSGARNLRETRNEGRGTAGDLKSETRHTTPIIALTAHALKGEKEKCLAAGMDDCIAKPIDEQQLFGVLIKWAVPEQLERPALKVQDSRLFQASARQARFEVSREALRPSEPPGPVQPAVSGTAAALDVSGVLKRLGNRKNIYVNMLKTFEPECGQDAETIRQCLAAGDIKSAERTAHSVKGTASNIGATALYDAALGLEKAIFDKRPDIDSCFQRFKKELDNALKAVSEFLAFDEGPWGP